MTDELEKIAAAAIRVPGGRIFTGVTHAGAQVSLIEDPSLTGAQKVDMMANIEDGFMTTEGRFVSREEAFQIAQHHKQMIDHPYANDPEANKAFYQGAQPKLDSGLLKEYAPMTRVGRVLLETQRHLPAASLSSRMSLALALTQPRPA